MTTYHVTVTREDNLWVAVIAGLPPNVLGATDVERFADLDTEVMDLIAGLTDTDVDPGDITWRYLFGDRDVTAHIAALRHVQATLNAVEGQRDDARLSLIRTGKGAGLSERTIADVLSMSHQRVNQLANT